MLSENPVVMDDDRRRQRRIALQAEPAPFFLLLFLWGCKEKVEEKFKLSLNPFA